MHTCTGGLATLQAQLTAAVGEAMAEVFGRWDCRPRPLGPADGSVDDAVRPPAAPRTNSHPPPPANSSLPSDSDTPCVSAVGAAGSTAASTAATATSAASTAASATATATSAASTAASATATATSAAASVAFTAASAASTAASPASDGRPRDTSLMVHAEEGTGYRAHASLMRHAEEARRASLELRAVLAALASTPPRLFGLQQRLDGK